MPPLTILVVDDQPAVLATLASVLRHHGYTVLEAKNGKDALALAAANKIDVALLDHSICDDEHRCLRDALRERQPALKAIVHTGNPEVDCMGDVPVLSKPVKPKDLVAKIESVAA